MSAAASGGVVMKFGGTSVGSAERIKAVAARIMRARGEGNDVVAVVSAMGDTTDRLIELADGVTEDEVRAKTQGQYRVALKNT